jgi:outer membrane protein OmpA-like peptidoglycan-associated protein/tetratricopeptide (TPR) repeat protein
VKGFKFILPLFLIAFGLNLDAQEIKTMKKWQLRDVYKNAALAKDYYTAIDALEELDYRKLLTEEQEIELATLYLKARDGAKALEWFEHLKSVHPNNPEVYYYYGESLRANGLAGTAKEYFERFYRVFDKTSAAYKAYNDKIRAAINSCDLALEIANNKSIEIYRQPDDINYPHNETAPFYISDDSLIYASTKTKEYRFEDELDVPRKEFFLASKNTDTSFTFTSYLDKFQEEGFDFDNPYFVASQNKLYFNKCQFRGTKTVCRLYYTDLGNTDTTVFYPSELEISVNTMYSIKQVSVFERTGYVCLIFTSDMPGGRGGNDLWYTSSQRPGKLINLGKKINTPGNEETPFFDTTKSRLYFSSDGHTGIGGMDIFSSDGFGKKWLKPENIGKPFNSPYDDTYYSHHYEDDSLSFGFLTSNRPGGTSLKSETCCDDIFYFKIKGITEAILEGQVDFENLSIGKFGGGPAKVQLYRLSDGEEVLIRETETDTDGKYAFSVEIGKKYAVAASREGYLSKRVTDVIKDPKTVVKNFTLLELSREPIVVKNIYYPFDQSYLTEQSKTVIDTTILPILLNNPAIIIELSSHTDWLGSDKYNKRLSQSRAESVVQYLIGKGIESKRLVAKGYGEDVPLVPNAFPDGRDNPDGRAKNRRTEFKIIGILPQYEDIIYEE